MSPPAAGRSPTTAMRVAATALPLLAACGHAADVMLATFDGAKGTTHTWGEQNDPVMGGRSNGTTAVEDGVLVFDAYCAIVPSLKAPGFVTSRTSDKVPFPDITGCDSISLNVKTAVAYAGYRFLFGNTHAPDGKFFARGYKAHFDAPPVGEFGDVVIPIHDFTDNWDDATGEPIKTCAEDKQYCPNAATLKNMGTMAFWGEGVEGKVHLEVRSVKATGCPAITSAAPAGAVPLVTFDGAAGTTHAFDEVNDPVMGGQSTGTWSVDTAGGFGVFDGEVVDVPSLKAPGFIKAQSKAGGYADASAAIGGDLVLTVRTTTPEYTGFRVSFASGALSPSFSCAGGGSLPGSRGCFKAKLAVPKGSDFTQVRIPFAKFSDKWSSATGEQTTTCAEDASVCPTAAKLGKIQDVEIWAEGALGKVHLEVKSVAAEAPAALTAPAGDLPLVTFDGAAGTTYKWSTLLDPVMGGKSNGTVAIKDGAAVFDAYCAIVPKLQAPGFVTMQTDGTQKFGDASAYSALKFTVRSATPTFKGFKVSFAASTLSDTFACATGRPQGGGGCFKAAFNATASWSDVVVPFAAFTDEWNSATGLPTGQTPPTAKNLKEIQRFAFWGEGVAGKVQLEVRAISAAA